MGRGKMGDRVRGLTNQTAHCHGRRIGPQSHTLLVPHPPFVKAKSSPPRDALISPF